MRLRRFYCVTHGYLCSAPSSATVLCGDRTGGTKSRRCNQRAVDHATYKEVTEKNVRKSSADH